MASFALSRKLNSVDENDIQTYHDFTRGRPEPVTDNDRETGSRRERQVGLWFWAVE
jgi:hypothetical protein